MLILTRKQGQSICLGDDICLTVIDVAGDKVRIGIDAPREVRVLREELVRTVDSNRLAAAGADTEKLRAAVTLLGAMKKMPTPKAPASQGESAKVDEGGKQ